MMNENITSLSDIIIEKFDTDVEYPSGIHPGFDGKNRGKNLDWVLIRTFDDEEEAKRMLSQEGMAERGLVRFMNHKFASGIKQYCKCRYFRKGCSAQERFTFFDGMTEPVRLEGFGSHENHPVKSSCVLKFSTIHSNIIDEAIKNNVFKPKAIIQYFKNHYPNVRVPIKTQITNYKARRQSEVGFNRGQVSCIEIENFCKEHMPVNPDDITDIDKAYVVNYDIVDYGEQPKIRIIISTKRMLALRSSVIHTDSSYKFDWEGCPGILFGFYDRRNTFHPKYIVITTTEKSHDYSFFLQIWKQYTPDCHPVYLISDNNEAIATGAKEVWPNIKHAVSFDHVYKHMEKLIKSSTKNKLLRSELLYDLNCIHLSWNENCFIITSQLFLHKWQLKAMSKPAEENDNLPSILEGFQHWFSINNKITSWHAGAIPGCYSNNTSIENITKTIKSDVIRKDELTFIQFCSKLLIWVSSESTRRNPDLLNEHSLLVYDSPSIDLPVWEGAYKLTKTPDHFRVIKVSTATVNPLENEDIELFCSLSPTSSPDPITQEGAMALAQQYQNMNWRHFDLYSSFLTHGRIVTKNLNSNWCCTCLEYSRHLYCVDSLAVEAIKGLVSIPLEACVRPIFIKKRGRGRGKKVKSGVYSILSNSSADMNTQLIRNINMHGHVSSGNDGSLGMTGVDPMLGMEDHQLDEDNTGFEEDEDDNDNDNDSELLQEQKRVKLQIDIIEKI